MVDAGSNANQFVGSSSLDGDEAAIAAARAASESRVADRQAQSAQFIVEHGAAVVGGHSPVGDVPPDLSG